MIGAISGTIIDKTSPRVLIKTTSGVFYEILVSDHVVHTLPEINNEALIYTSLIVREQEMYLVGFLSQGEKNLFEILITAKGIGPKQAIKILGEMSGIDLRSAIISGDTSRLSRIKGISAKKAEQLILDLREKMQKVIGDFDVKSITTDPEAKKKMEILLTMRALGYTDSEIKKPLDCFFETQETSKPTEQLVTDFLALLVANKI
ncbi:MAG: Holliday junction branch migration protein RuvA [Brevinema sp.]